MVFVMRENRVTQDYKGMLSDLIPAAFPFFMEGGKRNG
jgi:hypothetical protein